MTITAIPERPETEAFRFALRRATSAEHAALDAHPAFAALMAGTLDADGYRRLMAVFHGFYHVHDPMVTSACDRHAFDRLGFAYAARSEILGEDIASLGSGRPVEQGTQPPSLPDIHSAGMLGGVLYVIEGSMLGGAVLCRMAETLLFRTGIAGDAYWRWCREAGKTRWAMTCRMIEDLSACETARAEMIEGARTSFAIFSEWLDAWDEGSRLDGSGHRGVVRC